MRRAGSQTEEHLVNFENKRLEAVQKDTIKPSAFPVLFTSSTNLPLAFFAPLPHCQPVLVAVCLGSCRQSTLGSLSVPSAPQRPLQKALKTTSSLRALLLAAVFIFFKSSKA